MLIHYCFVLNYSIGVKRSRSIVSAIADVKNRALSGLTHPCLNHTMTTRDGINLHYQTIGEGSKVRRTSITCV